MNLFLDDIRNPINVLNYINNDIYKNLNWEIVRSYDEFVNFIEKNGVPNLISFDHDLSDEHYINMYNVNKVDFKEKTGYEALKWLCNYILNNNLIMPKIFFHTANHIGYLNMQKYLSNFLKHNPNISIYEF